MFSIGNASPGREVKASSVSSTLEPRSFKLCSRGSRKLGLAWEISTAILPSNSAAIFSGDLFSGDVPKSLRQNRISTLEKLSRGWRDGGGMCCQGAKIDRLAEERRARRATSAGVGGKATRRAGDREARGVESNPSAAAIPKREPSRLETLTSSPHNPKPLSERVSENRETLGRQGGGGVGVFRRAAMDAGRS